MILCEGRFAYNWRQKQDHLSLFLDAKRSWLRSVRFKKGPQIPPSQAALWVAQFGLNFCLNFCNFLPTTYTLAVIGVYLRPLFFHCFCSADHSHLHSQPFYNKSGKQNNTVEDKTNQSTANKMGKRAQIFVGPGSVHYSTKNMYKRGRY